MSDGIRYIDMLGHSGVSKKIAYESTPGPENKSIFWLCGFLSNMRSRKISALAEWCEGQGYGLTRFDYSGRGSSSGVIEDGCISDWLEEARMVFVEKTKGPQIIVGSSMGGWLGLLLLNVLGAERARVSSCVFIACLEYGASLDLGQVYSRDARGDNGEGSIPLSI